MANTLRHPSYTFLNMGKASVCVSYNCYTLAHPFTVLTYRKSLTCVKTVSGG